MLEPGLRYGNADLYAVYLPVADVCRNQRLSEDVIYGSHSERRERLCAPQLLAISHSGDSRIVIKLLTSTLRIEVGAGQPRCFLFLGCLSRTLRPFALALAS